MLANLDLFPKEKAWIFDRIRVFAVGCQSLITSSTDQLDQLDIGYGHYSIGFYFRGKVTLFQGWKRLCSAPYNALKCH